LPDSPAYGRYDLLTAVLHELGHLQGHDHTDDGLMVATLPTGTRRLPDDGVLHFEFGPHDDEQLPAVPFLGRVDVSVVQPDFQTEQPERADTELGPDAELPPLAIPYEVEPTSYKTLYEDRSRVEPDERDQLFGDLNADWLLLDPEDWLNRV
jgi:hypothetical protein